MSELGVLPIIFGLASGLVWGAGDFCGGLATKRANVYGVVIVGDSVGALLFAGLALAFEEPLPPGPDWWWGVVAGVVGAVGLIALYRALAFGRMSVASPVAAVVTALVPVLFGALAEGLPGQLQMAGFGFALVGVWLVSSRERARIQWSELGLPVVAGLGFGAFFIFIDAVSAGALFWPLFAARLAAVVALGVYAAATRQFQLPTGRLLPLMAAVGVLDAGGNAFFALAAQMGRLDVASVLASLYPASTVALAWLLLKERILRLQLIGVAAALLAIVLIAL
jgi:drug/metabolite transporter (DMT)-like permease